MQARWVEPVLETLFQSFNLGAILWLLGMSILVLGVGCREMVD